MASAATPYGRAANVAAVPAWRCRVPATQLVGQKNCNTPQRRPRKRQRKDKIPMAPLDRPVRAEVNLSQPGRQLCTFLEGEPACPLQVIRQQAPKEAAPAAVQAMPRSQTLPASQVARP